MRWRCRGCVFELAGNAPRRLGGVHRTPGGSGRKGIAQSHHRTPPTSHTYLHTPLTPPTPQTHPTFTTNIQITQIKKCPAASSNLETGVLSGLTSRSTPNSSCSRRQ